MSSRGPEAAIVPKGRMDPWRITDVVTGMVIVSLDPINYKDDGPLAWQERSLCQQTDPEAFFPEKGGSTREAKKVCGKCEVRSECLDYALEHGERYGIWGGLSERERRKLKWYNRVR